jgi:hypothetical protein
VPLLGRLIPSCHHYGKWASSILETSDPPANIATRAVGANAALISERLELGATYLTPLATQRDFEFSGILVKMVLRS